MQGGDYDARFQFIHNFCDRRCKEGNFRSVQTYGMSKLGGAVYNRPYSYEKRTHFAVDVGWLRIDRRASSLVLAPLNNPSGNRRYLIICA